MKKYKLTDECITIGEHKLYRIEALKDFYIVEKGDKGGFIESEENLSYLKEKSIEAYIKPANYEQIGTKKFEKEIGRKENMYYDKEEDCYICHNNKKLRKARAKTVKTASGYLREETHYYCSECDGCPYRGKCMSGNNWKKPL